ncbi:MAG: hypothetical protein Q9209_003677 [Squamulea sp. 1 TL-2023]
MTKLATINAAAIKVTRNMLPLLAGNLPRMIQYYNTKFEETFSEERPYLAFKIPPPTNQQHDNSDSHKSGSQRLAHLP